MYIYFENVQQVIDIHGTIISISGGLPGVKNAGYIESVIEKIKDDVYYPELENKLTHLVFSINKLHAFHDGNKRTSIATGAGFLELNGFDHIVTRFIREMENIAVCVAEGIIDKDFLEEIILSILFEDDYNETLKLRIIDALQTVSTDNNIEKLEDNEF